LQGEYGTGAWGATATVRADAVEGFATTPTVRVSLTRVLVGAPGEDQRLTARVGGGTSFRTPTFDDLFWPARASAAGNPNLQPEQSVDFDLGLGLATRAVQLDLSAFHARVTDLIQWSPGPDGVWRPHNLLAATLQGVELEGTVGLFPLGLPFTFQGSASWLDARDRTGNRLTGGKQLVGRSRFLGFGELMWEGGRWTAAAGVRTVSAMPVTAANTKWLDGYAVSHVRLAWTTVPALRLDLEARNLFDTSYEDVRGYATPGRELLLGFTFVQGGIGQ
jgi:outer membrane cobalamin receptor